MISTFEAREYREIAVKVIGDRGHELLVVKSLSNGSEKMNEFRIKILQAIREDKTSEQAIAEHLNVDTDRVYSNLEIL